MRGKTEYPRDGWPPDGDRHHVVVVAVETLAVGGRGAITSSLAIAVHRRSAATTTWKRTCLVDGTESPLYYHPPPVPVVHIPLAIHIHARTSPSIHRLIHSSLTP
eukprot:GHVU01123129.1.p1 GENE.GHVU01123129.1~~GHVU01123129.1.p1  ORF type:complete len:105 (-),score=4.60 GHVU01123129.1:376-690(-)